MALAIDGIRLVPAGVGFAAGSVDGILRNADVNRAAQNAGNAKIYKQFSAWYEVGLVVGGAALHMARFSEDVVDPMIILGAGLLGQRAGGWAAAQMQKPKTAMEAMEMPQLVDTSGIADVGGGRGRAALGRGQMPAVYPTRREPSGLLG